MSAIKLFVDRDIKTISYSYKDLHKPLNGPLSFICGDYNIFILKAEDTNIVNSCVFKQNSNVENFYGIDNN
jgi:hypothetical protein